MNNFIQISDYDASIHREILDALLRKDAKGYDPQIIEICEERAVAEMRTYMAKRYDCDAIFSAHGEDRNQLILMFALDIAIYHIFCQHNPYKISPVREDRYKRAIEWLKGILKGDVSIDGAPLLPDSQLQEVSPWQIDADCLRPTLL